MNPLDSDLGRVLEQTQQAMGRVRRERPSPMRVQEVGRVLSVSEGIARVQGLPHVGSEELVRFEGGEVGLTFNLDPGEIGVILLDSSEDLAAGDRARRTERVLDVPVGEALNGRVVDALGRPLDGEGPIRTTERWPVEREAPAVLDRAPVTQPLQTGWKVVDALIPIGRGQRELILGDRQTGKTTLALDTIINQKQTGVRCFYCAIGQRNAAVAGVVEQLRHRGAMEYTTVIVAGEEDPPGLRYVAPYGAMSMAEWIRDRGGDALLVLDDMTRHARSYRELSLLLRRPPGREAFPGDIFYIHSRLLERSTHLREDLGGGSLTALPIIETQAENISDYIPTNLISITDGQVYLSPSLFQKGVLPAVDVGKSVSRVGGKTQLPAYRSVVGDLRLSYSQFQELESFAHFGARLEPQTRRQLERGRRVREVLKQPEHRPLPAPEQIAVLLAVTEGLMDDVSLEEVPKAEEAIRRRVRSEGSDVLLRIESGEQLGESDRERLGSLARDALQSRQGP